MTTATLTVEHTLPDFTDEPPYPEGATNYERQELRTAWRNALGYYADVAQYAVQGFEMVARPQRDYVRESNNNAAQRLAQAQAAHERYRALLDGVHHRLAMDERAAKHEAKSGAVIKLEDRIGPHSADAFDVENGHPDTAIEPGFYKLISVERDDAWAAWNGEE